MISKKTVFLVDDDPDFRAALKQSLLLAGLTVFDFKRPEIALDKLDDTFAGVIVSDIRMAGMSGLEFLMQACEIDEDIPFILISGHADISTAVQAIQDGAYDLLEKPFRTQTIIDVIHRALEKRKLVLENRLLRTQLYQQRNRLILGDSSLINSLRNSISNHAQKDINVLISGELGTGKELVALSLHEQSNRSKRSFNTLNCGSLTKTKLESTLFGKESSQQPDDGLLNKSHRGTLYLEEIDQLPNKLAVNLLQKIRQISAARRDNISRIFPDVRIIASSHVPLAPLCKTGQFREDLYYELSVLELDVPSLRDRREDIPLLFEHFVTQSSRSYGVPEPDLSEKQITQLIARNWHGNLRALRHMAERWVLDEDRPNRDADIQIQTGKQTAPASLPDKIEAFEKLIIEQALQSNGGNVTKTHTELGIPRKTLYDKLQRHHIKPEQYRNQRT